MNLPGITPVFCSPEALLPALEEERKAPFRLHMGLARVDEVDWIACDQAGLLPLRWALLEQRHEAVFAALPDTEALGQEVQDMLAAHLATHCPQRFTFQEEGRFLLDSATGARHDLAHPGRHPLERAARLVAEDLCVLASDTPGTPQRLVAACVCFPSRWPLADKAGQGLAAIHGPVPFYPEHLAAAMDRLFANLRPGMILQRSNWTIHDSATLFQPTAQPPQAITAQEAPGRFFVRSERQTLRRLPQTGAILFTILTRLCPLSEMLKNQACRAALGEALANLPDEVIAYRGLAPYRDMLLTLLAAPDVPT